MDKTILTVGGVSLFSKVDYESKRKLLIAYISEKQNDFYRVAYSYTKNREMALDIVQDTILSSLESVNSVKKPEFIRTWFYRILINKCLTYIKRSSRTVSSSEILENYPSEEAVSEEIFDLYKAVDMLEPNQKTVIVLRYFEDMKIEDIAEIVKSNPSTIKSRIKAALKNLKHDFQKGE